MAAVLVHIDLEAGQPDPSSLVALAAGRTLATSWGAPLYAGVIAEPPLGAISGALSRAGADQIIVAPTGEPIAPLWDAVGPAWQGVLDRVRPRVVLFGADAPSAAELGPRTAARLGARLFVRARAVAQKLEDAIVRDRDGVRAHSSDAGAVVALIGGAVAELRGGEHAAETLALPPVPGEARVEVVGSAPDMASACAVVVALGDTAAKDPQVVADARRLAALVGGRLVAGPGAAVAGIATVERLAPFAPELCVLIGDVAIDLAGAASVVAIGTVAKLADGALSGSAGAGLADLVDRLERIA